MASAETGIAKPRFTESVKRGYILLSFDSARIDVVFLPVGKGADRVFLVLQPPILTEFFDRFFNYRMRSDR